MSVTVTDSNGGSGHSPVLNITTYVDPTVGTPTANRSSVDVGQSVTFTASSTAGSGGLSYAWWGLPTGCQSTGSSAVCQPTGAGTFHVGLNLTDTNGWVATSGNLSFVVWPDPTVALPTGERSSLDVGQSVHFDAVTTSGYGNLSYLWSGLPHGCSSTNASAACTAVGAANLSVTLTVTDSNGYTVESLGLAFEVYNDPTVDVPSANRSSSDAGQAVTYSVTGTPVR